jgi:hypothetical protein
MHRNDEIKAIANKWMEVMQRRGIDSRPAWYLYNLACGHTLRDDEMLFLRNWLAGIDHGKEDSAAVDIYMARMLSYTQEVKNET